MNSTPSYEIFALGDSAITIDFGNRIDPDLNQKVIDLFHHLQQNPIKGMIEAVPAYSSVTIYYDVLLVQKFINDEISAFDWMKKEIHLLLQDQLISISTQPRLMKIPVCYEKEFGPDLEWIATQKNLSISELISLHTSKKYRVYMIGFLPGFAYMGEVDERIAVPRKLQPRQQVEAGSVGIAGKQTGIYPLASPGGWQIIGKTPAKLFQAPVSSSSNEVPHEQYYESEPVLLKVGDDIQFFSITKEEFLYLKP